VETLAIPIGTAAELTKPWRAEWSIAIRSVMIYRDAMVVGAGFRVFAFPIGRRVLPSGRRV
jgi:hypothetical protein